MNIKFQSLRRELTTSGSRTTLTYQGSQAEMTEFAALPENQPGKHHSEYGRLKSAVLSAGVYYELELSYESGAAGNSVDPPDPEYGKKSVSISTSMLSLPLEKCPKYRTCWNYYLLAPANGSGSTPGWWNSASDLADANGVDYQWSKTPASAGSGWKTLKSPKKPGVEHIDWPTYTLTETVRVASVGKGVDLIKRKVNKITNPANDKGLNISGNWKCDSADLRWSGSYWLVRLTYTASGDSNGWDRDLYS